jgi:hypothetical protein
VHRPGAGGMGRGELGAGGRVRSELGAGWLPSPTHTEREGVRRKERGTTTGQGAHVRWTRASCAASGRSVEGGVCV